MRQRLLAAIVGIPSFFALLFGIGAGHALLTSSAMAAMGEQMTQNQCQSSCLSQTNVIASERKIEIDDKDIKPQPTKPYYLAFMGTNVCGSPRAHRSPRAFGENAVRPCAGRAAARPR